MRILILIIGLFTLNFAPAQWPLVKTKWSEKERELGKDKKLGKIDIEKWHKKIRIEAGSLGTSFEAIVVSKSQIAASSQIEKGFKFQQGVTVVIPKMFSIQKENGGRSIQIFLVNNTDTTVVFSRIDETVISNYVKVQNDWILLRGTPIIRCGMGPFNDSLAKKSFMTIEINNADRGDGDIKIPFKIKFQMDGHLIESNEVKIKLHQNQINRLVEENKILMQTQK